MTREGNNGLLHFWLEKNVKKKQADLVKLTRIIENITAGNVTPDGNGSYSTVQYSWYLLIPWFFRFRVGEEVNAVAAVALSLVWRSIILCARLQFVLCAASTEDHQKTCCWQKEVKDVCQVISMYLSHYGTFQKCWEKDSLKGMHVCFLLGLALLPWPGSTTNSLVIFLAYVLM